MLVIIFLILRFICSFFYIVNILLWIDHYKFSLSFFFETLLLLNKDCKIDLFEFDVFKLCADFKRLEAAEILFAFSLVELIFIALISGKFTL